MARQRLHAIGAAAAAGLFTVLSSASASVITRVTVLDEGSIDTGYVLPQDEGFYVPVGENVSGALFRDTRVTPSGAGHDAHIRETITLSFGADAAFPYVTFAYLSEAACETQACDEQTGASPITNLLENGGLALFDTRLQDVDLSVGQHYVENGFLFASGTGGDDVAGAALDDLGGFLIIGHTGIDRDTRYRIDFGDAALANPLPGAALFLLTGLGGIAVLRRR